MSAPRDMILRQYAAIPASSAARDLLFKIIFAICLATSGSGGALLLTVKISPDTPAVLAKKIKASFVMPEKKAPPKPKPKKIEDLTKKPLLKQQESHTAKKVVTRTVTRQRKVYGLRRVFAKGLGTGGSGGSAIVSKLGNTLEKEPDTLKATPEDLKGPLVSTATVTSAPVLKSRVKPEYTEEMIANKVEGIIRAKVLVDIDGSVKEVQVLNDLGFGSRAVAESAFKQLKFKPAMRGREPVATRITIKYNFIFQD